jgi:hypothetical protein
LRDAHPHFLVSLQQRKSLRWNPLSSILQ